MEIEAALEAAKQVGILMGRNEVLAKQVEKLTETLHYKQEECDELRARAARSEGLLAQAQTTLNEMSAAVDGHWRKKDE